MTKEIYDMSTKTILKNAFVLYKDNFQTLISVSAFITLTLVAKQLWEATVGGKLNNSIGVFNGVTNLIVKFGLTATTTISSILLVIIISNFYNREEMSLSRGINVAKSKFWRYVGNSILLGLILAIPLLIEITIIRSQLSIIPKIVLAGVFSIPIIYLVTIFSFVMYLVCIDETSAGRLSKSKELCRGQFFKVLVINLVISGSLDYGFYIIKTIIAYSKVQSVLTNIIVELCAYSWFLFSTPFATCITIELIYRLLDKKDMVINDKPLENTDMENTINS